MLGGTIICATWEDQHHQKSVARSIDHENVAGIFGYSFLLAPVKSFKHFCFLNK
jgi:hypothetical protein